MTWSKVSFTWHPLRHLSLTITPLAYKSHLRTPVPQHAPCKWLVPILDRMFKFMLVPVQCACSCRIWVAPSYSCQHRSKSLNKASRNGVSFFRILTPHRSVSLWSFKYFKNSWARWKNMLWPNAFGWMPLSTVLVCKSSLPSPWYSLRKSWHFMFGTN